MSTSAPATGVASLTWSQHQPASLVVHAVTRENPIDRYMSRVLDDPAATVAVDVPFGWPSGFAAFLQIHAKGPAALPSPAGKAAWSALASRETDRRVRKTLGIQGLSVSFDKLGATAAKWSEIEYNLHTERGYTLDRSGRDGQIIETWPRAAWNRFVRRDENPAKLSREDFVQRLKGVVDFDSPSWIEYPESRREHAQDAIVCALVARAKQINRTVTPQEPRDIGLARSEGWIHIPDAALTLSALRA